MNITQTDNVFMQIIGGEVYADTHRAYKGNHSFIAVVTGIAKIEITTRQVPLSGKISTRINNSLRTFDVCLFNTTAYAFYLSITAGDVVDIGSVDIPLGSPDIGITIFQIIKKPIDSCDNCFNNSKLKIKKEERVMNNYTRKETDKHGDTRYFNDTDQLHRTDGPAVEGSNGRKFWYVNGERHRLDGPAVEYAGGDKFWYVNGEYHRLDGPAVEYAGGDKSWYVNGEELTEEEFNKHPLVIERMRKKKKAVQTINEIRNHYKQVAEKAKNRLPPIGSVVKLYRKAFDWSLDNPDVYTSPVTGELEESWPLVLARSMFFEDLVCTVSGYGAHDDNFKQSTGVEAPFIRIEVKLDGEVLSNSYHSMLDIEGYGFVPEKQNPDTKYFVHYVEGCSPKVYVADTKKKVGDFLNKWINKHGSFDDNGDNWVEADKIYCGEKISLKEFLEYSSHKRKSAGKSRAKGR